MFDARGESVRRRPRTKGTGLSDLEIGLARYLAHRYGADVTGIELTPARVKGAAALTKLVGLQDRVRVIEGTFKRSTESAA